MLPSVAAIPRASPWPERLALLLVFGWLVAAAQLLWHFERQRLALSTRLVHFGVADLPAPPRSAPAGAARILFFLDDNCHCNAAALAEIDRLRRATLLPAARFVTGTAETLLPGDAVRLAAAEHAAWADRVPAAPAVALWDARGRLVYFGPINVAAGCGDGASYLHSALRTMGTDASAVFGSWDVVTCACQGASSFHS